MKYDDEHPWFLERRVLSLLQVTSDISVDSRRPTVQGLMFPFDENVIEALHLFKREKTDYVQLVNKGWNFAKSHQVFVDYRLESGGEAWNFKFIDPTYCSRTTAERQRDFWSRAEFADTVEIN